MSDDSEKDSGKKDNRFYIVVFIALIIALVTNIIVMRSPGDPISLFTIIFGILGLIFVWLVVPWLLIRDLGDKNK
jgi:hypothetical protein